MSEQPDTVEIEQNVASDERDCEGINTELLSSYWSKYKGTKWRKTVPGSASLDHTA
jgi:hypothetical protein